MVSISKKLIVVFMFTFILSQSIWEFANKLINVTTCQKAYQFFNYFSKEFFNFLIFQSSKYLGSPIQADHNSRRSQYSHVFFILFSCFSCEKFEKILVTCNVEKPELFTFSFLTQEQKRKIITKKLPQTCI